jgi:acetolactate synthase-1/2/3 large subunit
MLGMHGNYTNILTNECDVLIALGMRLMIVTGNLETYAKQAKVIHLKLILRSDKKCKDGCGSFGDVKL